MKLTFPAPPTRWDRIADAVVGQYLTVDTVRARYDIHHDVCVESHLAGHGVVRCSECGWWVPVDDLDGIDTCAACAVWLDETTDNED